MELTWELLGLAQYTNVADYAATQSEARAQVVTLAIIITAYEGATSQDSWRYVTSTNARYFRWLAANNYPLSDVEALSAGIEALPEASDVEENGVAA